MKRTLYFLMSLPLILASGSSVSAQSSNASATGSALSAMGSATLVVGSVQVLAAGARLIVASVETVGDVATVVLRDVASAAEFTVRLWAVAVETASQAASAASEAGGTASLAVGASIATVAVRTGVILGDSAGNVVALIVNELGKAMFHRTKHTDQ